MKKRELFVYVSIIGVLVILFGVTYAFFTYTRTSSEVSKLITGQIYLHYNEGQDSINLSGAFPESDEVARGKTDNYVTFTIDGVNTTTNEDIYYEIILNKGSDVADKTRLLDKHLKFDLVETIDGVSETVLSGVNYDTINGTRIWVNTVNRNTREELVVTYQLRMWIDENVWVSDTDAGADYTTVEFKNSYATVKIDVMGDLLYKEVATPATFFTYEEAQGNATFPYLMAELNFTEETIAACVDHMNNVVTPGEDNSNNGDGYQTFCEGSDTWNGFDLTNALAAQYINVEDFMAFGMVTSYQVKNRHFRLETSANSVAICQDYMLNAIYMEDLSDDQDEYYNYCKGFGTVMDSTFYDDVTNNLFYQSDISYFLNEGALIEDKEAFTGVQITGYDVAGGANVIIPSRINGSLVTSIAANSFENKGIVNVRVPKTVTYMGENAFANNPLELVYVKGNPYMGENAFATDSVKFDTFSYNGTCAELTAHKSAFTKGPINEITKDASCGAIAEN